MPMAFAYGMNKIRRWHARRCSVTPRDEDQQRFGLIILMRASSGGRLERCGLKLV